MDLNNCQVYASRLQDGSVDLTVKLAIVNELRDAIEIVQSQDYPKYLALILPPFISLLSVEISPVFINTQTDQKLRLTLLEILHRLPQSDALRPYAQSLMACLMDVLRNDNEENASVALKIIVDLHKNFKTLVEEHVQPFFDFVQDSYKNMSTAVERAFSEDASVSLWFTSS